MVEQYANNAQTTLSANCAAGDATITVTSSAAFPATPQGTSGTTGAAGQFRVIIDSEILLVTQVSGTTWTVTRGAEGTAAASHTAGTSVTQILTAAGLQAVATNPAGAAATRGQGVFIASNFDQNASNLYLMASTDGITWRYLIQKPVLTGVRDPSLYYDGSFWWCAFTRTTAPTASWALWKSSDLENWTHVVDVDCSGIIQASGAVTLAWAPEFVVDSDGSLHVIVSLGHANNTMQLYEQHSTAADNSTWSAAVALTGTALPADMIDAYVLKAGGTYYCFYKNDTNKYVEVMTSTSLTSGYTVQGSGHWMTNWPVTSGNGWEGPSIVQIDGNTWYMYVDSTDVSDNGLGQKYSVYTGAAGAGWLTGANWSNLAGTNDPMTKRHGTVLRVQDMPGLRAILGCRLQSKVNPRTQVGLTAAFSCPNSVNQPITFDTVNVDDLGMYSGTKMTAQVTGWYWFNAWVHWSGNAAGLRALDLRFNGTTYFGGRIDGPFSGATDTKQNAGAQLVFMHAGDYIEAVLFQNSGGALTITEGNFACGMLDG